MKQLEIKKIKVRSEWKVLLPKLSAEERKNLENSIKENGVEAPVRLLKSTTFLLDGHNRYEIAKKLGLNEIPYAVVDTGDPEQWILTNQLTRRNLSELNRDKIVAQLAKRGVDKDKIAEAAKVSPSTVGRIVKQQKEIEKLPTHVKAEIEEAGTRRAANAIIKENQPQDPRRKLKNDILDYRSLLINVLDGAMNLEEDGLKGITRKVKDVFHENKLEGLIDYLEKEVQELKAAMKDTTKEHTLDTTKPYKLKA